jgi:hypothetical protein
MAGVSAFRDALERNLQMSGLRATRQRCEVGSQYLREWDADAEYGLSAFGMRVS